MSLTDIAQWSAIVILACGVLWLFVCVYERG